jgi:hypothetical protein
MRGNFARLPRQIGIRPARLFHYTSQEGLLGIISSRVVWATNLLYLNDSSELLYGFTLARDVFKSMLADKNSKSVIDFLKQGLGLLDVSALLPNRDYYTFCLCQRPDLLSQWRAYAASGGGYAIGFEMHDLALAASRQGFGLFPVEYGLGENTTVLGRITGDLPGTRSLCSAISGR